jgi:hypothetical protein
MLKRLFVGLFIGLVLGGLLAAVLIKGLGVTVFAAGAGGAGLAYLFAAVTGVVVGLIAGKPIWASGGQIEAGLKAFFGALLGAGIMFGLRRFVTTEISLDSVGAGTGAIGTLVATTLPIIAALLGGFYEVDNTPEPDKKGEKEKSGGSAGKSGAKVRVAANEEASDEDGIEEPKKAKK